MAGHEELAVHDLVENSETTPSNEAEIKIQNEMRDVLLGNEDTARITYALSANETKDNFTIRLGNLSGIHRDLNFDGTHDTVAEVNRYILAKFDALENPTTLDPTLMLGYDAIGVAILQDQINQTIERVR